MFKNIWIINDLGLCVYHRNFSGEATVDEQLMSGLLVALRQYSEEALKLSLYTLGGKERKLVIAYGRKTRMLGAVECDQEDNPGLVEKIIKKAVMQIPEEYRGADTVKQYSSEDFDRFLEGEIFRRQRKIGKTKDLLALMMVLIIAAFYSIGAYIDYIEELYDAGNNVEGFIIECSPAWLAGIAVGYISVKEKVVVTFGILEIIALNVVLYSRIADAWFAAAMLGIMSAIWGYAIVWIIKGNRLFYKQKSFLDRILG